MGHNVLVWALICEWTLNLLVCAIFENHHKFNSVLEKCQWKLRRTRAMWIYYDLNLPSEIDKWFRMWVQYHVKKLWKLDLWNAGSMYVAFLEVNDWKLTNYEGKGKIVGMNMNFANKVLEIHLECKLCRSESLKTMVDHPSRLWVAL